MARRNTKRAADAATEAVADAIDAQPRITICGVCATLTTLRVQKEGRPTVYHEDGDCIIFPAGDPVGCVIGIWKRHGEIDRLHVQWLRERTMDTAQDRHPENTVFGCEMSKDHHLCCEVKLGG